MLFRRSEYDALPSADDDRTSDLGRTETKERSCEPGTSSTRLDTIARWSLCIIAACALVDSLALYRWYTDTRITKLSDLPLRSSYAALDTLYKETTKPTKARGPIINLPRAFALVNSSTPNAIINPPAETWMTPKGVVPIGTRRFVVSDEVSSIAQFRVMDFGMEKCSLTVVVPPQAYNTSTYDGGVIRGEGRADGKVEVNIWRLQADSRLNFKQLSWNTRPKRSELLGSLVLGYDTKQETGSFPCASNSYQTVEVGGSGKGGVVEIWAGLRTPIGLYMNQYQTI